MRSEHEKDVKVMLSSVVSHFSPSGPVSADIACRSNVKTALIVTSGAGGKSFLFVEQVDPVLSCIGLVVSNTNIILYTVCLYETSLPCSCYRDKRSVCLPHALELYHNLSRRKRRGGQNGNKRTGPLIVAPSSDNLQYRYKHSLCLKGTRFKQG